MKSREILTCLRWWNWVEERVETQTNSRDCTKTVWESQFHHDVIICLSSWILRGWRCFVLFCFVFQSLAPCKWTAMRLLAVIGCGIFSLQRCWVGESKKTQNTPTDVNWYSRDQYWCSVNQEPWRGSWLLLVPVQVPDVILVLTMQMMVTFHRQEADKEVGDYMNTIFPLDSMVTDKGWKEIEFSTNRETGMASHHTIHRGSSLSYIWHWAVASSKFEPENPFCYLS